jgi:hypothetical protein
MRPPTRMKSRTRPKNEEVGLEQQAVSLPCEKGVMD